VEITIIRTPVLLPIGSVTAHQGVPPLGLAYLGAYLRKNHHQVSYIDSLGEKINTFSPSGFKGIMVNGLTIEEIIPRIPPTSKALVVSCMFSNEWFYTEQLIAEFKKHFPEIKIIIGGEHATADFEYILKNNQNIDFAILGEGETKLLSLIEGLENHTPLQQISGICYFDKLNNQVIKTSQLPRIKNLKNIPWPDWEGIPLNKYLDLGLGMAAQGKRTYPTLASRGCPYQCTFCSSPTMWTTTWISRDIDDLINEINFAKNKYQITNVEFYDLTAIINTEWIKEFCRKMIDQKIDVSWSLPSGTRSEALSLEVIQLLKASGCQKLTYAPETGSDRLLNKIKKKVNLEHMLFSMSSAAREGIIVKANIVFGFPDQTYKDLIYDFMLLFKLAMIGIHDVTCFAFSPYPGSELFLQLENEGKIKRDANYNRFLSANVYNSPLNMKSWNKKIPSILLPLLTLGGMSLFYILQFLIRPNRFLKLITNFIHNTPETMLDLALDGIKNDFIKGRRISSET
jgi:radical SAM superfamily enzyme YgiQ (UPF0313 family)